MVCCCVQGNEPHVVRTKAVVNRMALYPLILAFVYTAPLIHRCCPVACCLSIVIGILLFVLLTRCSACL